MILVLFHPITDEMILFTKALSAQHCRAVGLMYYEFSLEDALLEGFTVIGEL